MGINNSLPNNNVMEPKEIKLLEEVEKELNPLEELEKELESEGLTEDDAIELEHDREKEDEARNLERDAENFNSVEKY